MQQVLLEGVATWRNAHWHASWAHRSGHETLHVWNLGSRVDACLVLHVWSQVVDRQSLGNAHLASHHAKVWNALVDPS